MNYHYNTLAYLQEDWTLMCEDEENLNSYFKGTLKNMEKVYPFIYELYYLREDTQDKYPDIGYKAHIATGKNSEMIVERYMEDADISIRAFDKTYKINERNDSQNKCDLNYLRELVSAIDYVGTSLNRTYASGDYYKAKNSKTNDLYLALQNALEDYVENKENCEKINFLSVLGKENYERMQARNRYRALKSVLIAQSKIPAESDQIKYPRSLAEFEVIRPEIERLYGEINDNNNSIKAKQATLSKLYEGMNYVKGQLAKKKNEFCATKEEKELNKLECDTLRANINIFRTNMNILVKEINLLEKGLSTKERDNLKKIADLCNRKTTYIGLQNETARIK